MAEGTSFEVDLSVKGEGPVASAATALDRLSASLVDAGAKTLAAADAVKAGEAAYSQAESAADRAAKAMEKIGLAIQETGVALEAADAAGDLKGAERARAKLEALNARQSEAAQKANFATMAMVEQAAALDKLKTNAGAAADAEAKIAKELGKAKETAANAAKAQTAAAGSGKVNEIAEGFGKLGGPLGAVGQKVFGAAEGVKKLGASLGSLGPHVAVAIAVVALIAGAVALTAAVVVSTAKVTAWAVSLADAARTQRLLSDGIARSVKGGRELDKTIDSLSNDVPLAPDKLREMAKGLADGGLRGKDLAKALEDAAFKAAQLEFGPDFQKQMLSLPFQTARLKRGFDKIFSGLNIEKLLEKLSKFVALFDEGSATANAAKVVFESVFQPIIDGLTGLVPKAVTTFIKLEILFMKAAIMVKPYISKIALLAAAFGILAAIIVGVLIVAVASIAVPFVVAAVAITAVIAAVLALVIYFDQIVAAIKGAFVSAWDLLISKVNEAVSFLKGLSLGDVATAMIDGLVAGISGAGAKVLGALTGVVGGAVTGAKKFLGIASPSKLLADEVGMNMGEGAAAGVDKAAGSVQASLESAVTPAAGTGAAAAAAATGGGEGGSGGEGGGGIVQHFEGAQFIFPGVSMTEWLDELLALAGGEAPDAA